MISAAWRKRFSILRNRLYLYPAPEPMAHTRSFWLAMGLVSLAVLLFSGFFIFYLLSGHNAYLTNAEDLGIMDQAIWNTAHGHMLHQTICNILHDTNCYSQDGITRFAIHFEPILFPISLLYLIWPDPGTLIVLQTLVVAAGAYPAFWLARLRLRNEWAGVVIALVYLLYPAQQQATVYDFHAVTFTASLLLFALYFMYTRKTVWLFVFAILAMACKEEIPLVVTMFGLWSMVFQRRWRSGLGLVFLGLIWFLIAYFLIPRYFSPTGHPLLVGRYSDVGLGKGPVQMVVNIISHPKAFWDEYVWQPDRQAYLHILFSPGGYIPPLKFLKWWPPIYLVLFAPWILVLALPTLAANMLSSYEQMYSGLFQYNAEIVPVLIFSCIEAIVLILWLVQMLFAWLNSRQAHKIQSEVSHVEEHTLPLIQRNARWVHTFLLAALAILVLFSAVRADYTFHGNMPFSKGFQWPEATPHTALAEHFIAMIPADASVSAQSKLVPHLSHRTSVYLFPYGDGLAKHSGSIKTENFKADYIFLDVTGDVYPFYGSPDYIYEVKSVLLSGNYGIVAAQDGYLLLKQGLNPPSTSQYSTVQPGAGVDTMQVLPNLPENFCSNIYTSPDKVPDPHMQVSFSAPEGKNIDLLGFSVGAPDTFSHSGGYMSVATYWRISAPITSALQVLFIMEGSDGREYFASTDVPSLLWCQTNMWQPDKVIRLESRVFGLQRSHVPNGLAHISVALLPMAQPSSKIMDIHARLPLHVVNVPGTVSPTDGTNALQLKSMTLVP
ncbi:DUF2079 domain-containing protein [Ktedonosporobacter rubrisoli]|uniref:DUF2079 domain-containing protein n=1 Tax=Ktedonosporobacter rubrisoli TaxID=2509675 RepID=A0A4P6K379_KTERU|nr:DUF2079 domain-containing protein [Ktedonosporobacter rubrisoli]QBD82353.1 DUF2079 domain-containing protein [Ktedonosporobacter rubrisoli]